VQCTCKVTFVLLAAVSFDQVSGVANSLDKIVQAEMFVGSVDGAAGIADA
jgi:hypothetical protein